MLKLQNFFNGNDNNFDASKLCGYQVYYVFKKFKIYFVAQLSANDCATFSQVFESSALRTLVCHETELITFSFCFKVYISSLPICGSQNSMLMAGKSNLCAYLALYELN